MTQRLNQFAVAQAIGGIGNRIRDIAKEDTRRQVDLANIGLKQQQLDLMGVQKEREHELKVAGAGRQQELDTPNTMGNLIGTLPPENQEQATAFLTNTVDPATERPFIESVSTPRKFVDSFGKIRALIAEDKADKAKVAAEAAKQESKQTFTAEQNEAKIASNEKINTAKITSAEKIAGARNEAALKKSRRALRTEATKQWTELQASLVEPETDPSTGKPFTRRGFINTFVADVEGIAAEQQPASNALDAETARGFMRQAKGDKAVAEQLAQEAGFTF